MKNESVIPIAIPLKEMIATVQRNWVYRQRIYKGLRDAEDLYFVYGKKELITEYERAIVMEAERKQRFYKFIGKTK